MITAIHFVISLQKLMFWPYLFLYHLHCWPLCRDGLHGTVKFLNLEKPKNFAVIYLKFKQRGQNLVYFVKMMQIE